MKTILTIIGFLTFSMCLDSCTSLGAANQAVENQSPNNQLIDLATEDSQEEQAENTQPAELEMGGPVTSQDSEDGEKDNMQTEEEIAADEVAEVTAGDQAAAEEATEIADETAEGAEIDLGETITTDENDNSSAIPPGDENTNSNDMDTEEGEVVFEEDDGDQGSAFPAGLEVGIPEFAGNGCPAASATVYMGDSADDIFMFFHQYVAKAGGASKKSLVRKSCSVAIPITIPAGIKVGLYNLNYFGDKVIPKGGKGQLKLEQFFVGQQGVTTVKTFAGKSDSSFIVGEVENTVSTIWTKCGESSNLRINSSLLVKTNAKQEETILKMDGLLAFGLIWEACD